MKTVTWEVQCGVGLCTHEFMTRKRAQAFIKRNGAEWHASLSKVTRELVLPSKKRKGKR